MEKKQKYARKVLLKKKKTEMNEIESRVNLNKTKI